MGDWKAGALVIFGITGDLAAKMTLPALYRLERRGVLRCPVVGVASGGLSTSDLRDLARQAIEKSGEYFDETVFARLVRRLTYVGGDANDPDLYEALAEELANVRRPLYYLALPPSLFAPVVERLSARSLLAYPPPARPYAIGTWGPPTADTLVEGYPAWQPPWLPGT
ncbi:hypothetical protein NQK81_35595 [Amycolatopsis roodepoortensis]|uniref:hypothetical protein n=1 Tax=Amycolatopsis roodepoortensis TaxID=700274 RepID=UPI00214C8E3F|nr:hypothetical protein [Amycolatopsis roodepoortensis]UUV30046.1 hypothetical protein NQK81_35595 [Amycolatopsis roodepoortensis]